MSKKTVRGLIPVTNLQWTSLPIEDCKWTYALRCTVTGRIKIGIADDVQKRGGDIQRMCATELQLILAVPSVGNELEIHLHRKFDQYRTHGEWFDSQEVAEFLFDMQRRYKDELAKLSVDVKPVSPEIVEQGGEKLAT